MGRTSIFTKCVCWDMHACRIICNLWPSTNTLSRMDLCTLIGTQSIICGLSEGAGGGILYRYIYTHIINMCSMFTHLCCLYVWLAATAGIQLLGFILMCEATPRCVYAMVDITTHMRAPPHDERIVYVYGCP